MDYIDIYRSYAGDYFKELGVSYKRTRARQVVLPMGAFINAMRYKLGPTDIGKIFGIHHSTVLYHQGIHEDRMMYQDYRNFFESATNKVNEAAVSIKSSLNAIHMLRGDNEETVKIIDAIDNESWIAIECCIEKLIEDYGISIKTTPALKQEVDIAAKNLCTMLLRHIQIEQA